MKSEFRESGSALAAVRSAIKRHWGYDDFLNLQCEAISADIAGRDSLVVLPTGGGKSLCFQAPAVCRDGTTLVISPLISLMKDQVDALIDCGVAAARVDSSQTDEGRSTALRRFRERDLKLLYLSPERLMSASMLDELRETPPSAIVIDEAHCVSMWGHDFRPEYRQLGQVKKLFPDTPVHAFTATATRRVRDDIVEQLNLRDAEVLVGDFHRPNLVYSVKRQSGLFEQVKEIIERHSGESGIIYRITRRDVDNLTTQLRESGYKVVGYHAGMEPEKRKRAQNAFSEDKANIIVATVAFGMGIDKSDVRFVIHAGMPKSLEHYQQESGRAGRDRMEADCVLLFSGRDYGTWKQILSSGEHDDNRVREINLKKLSEMYDYCTGVTCRHKTLIEYFGQEFAVENCRACDICLDSFQSAERPLEIAQKILSGVKRLDERFGAAYTTLTLVGSTDKRIREYGHDSLSTYGILQEHGERTVRDWLEQLVSQGFLDKSGEYNTLNITETGWGVLRSEVTPKLIKPSPRKSTTKTSQVAEDLWSGVDRELFEDLRALRKRIAEQKNIPPFVVFHDTTLRDMARKKPDTREAFLDVSGVGEKKAEEYGTEFISLIREYARQALV